MTKPVAIDVSTGHRELRQQTVGRFLVSDLQFKKDQELTEHFHPNPCLTVVVEGCFVQRFPNREYRCPPGGVLGKPPGEKHRDHWPTDARHLVIQPLEPQHESIPELGSLTNTVIHRVDPAAAAIARNILHELEVNDRYSPLGIEGGVLQLLVHLLRTDDDSSREAPDWLRPVTERLQDDVRVTPSLDELAELVGVHRSHLTRTFRRVHGKSVGEFAREVRLNRARQALSETDTPIGMVALRCGFSDQSHLTRSLKEATGMTPGVFRKAQRAKLG